jgi:hypothetical protein
MKRLHPWRGGTGYQDGTPRTSVGNESTATLSLRLLSQQRSITEVDFKQVT